MPNARSKKTAKKAVKKICKDCPKDSKRPAPYRGPRCASHHRDWVKQVRRRTHDAYIKRTYGISGEQYWEIYDAQGGHCYICRFATGATKLLSVDHDHRCCPGRMSCGRCVRGLLCSVCNQFLGYVHNDANAFLRGAVYVVDPPARKVLS